MTRADSASRVIGVDAAAVFAALVDPLALAAWLPPDGMSGRIERFDARPGGGYRMALGYDPDAAGAGTGKTTGDSDVVAREPRRPSRTRGGVRDVRDR